MRSWLRLIFKPLPRPGLACPDEVHAPIKSSPLWWEIYTVHPPGYSDKQPAIMLDELWLKNCRRCGTTLAPTFKWRDALMIKWLP